MALDNEQVVRRAYQIAEEKDMAGCVAAFTDDGTFTDESIGVTWSGPEELPEQVENYARAFPDMHRELHRLYVSGDIVVVQLASREPTWDRCACRRDAAGDRQADGRPALRRLPAGGRQDQALRLLPPKARSSSPSSAVVSDLSAALEH